MLSIYLKVQGSDMSGSVSLNRHCGDKKGKHGFARPFARVNLNPPLSKRTLGHVPSYIQTLHF